MGRFAREEMWSLALAILAVACLAPTLVHLAGQILGALRSP